MSKDYIVLERYSHEISEINNKLTDLENNRIYEFTNWTQDGYLATNAQQLKEKFNKLYIKLTMN